MFNAIVIIASLISVHDDTIKPEDMVNHYDKVVTVKMEVQSAKLLADRGFCFLNSKKDYRDKDNVSIIIKATGLKSLKAADIEDPAEHFKGKTVLINGKVEKYRAKPQIEIKNSDQIKIVESKDDQEHDDENDDKDC